MLPELNFIVYVVSLSLWLSTPICTRSLNG